MSKEARSSERGKRGERHERDRARTHTNARARTIFTRVLAVVVWVLIWALLAWFINKPLIFAGPLEMFQAFCALLPTQKFWVAIGVSIAQVLSGFFIAFLLALGLALLALKSKLIRAFLRPAMNFLKSVPVVCIIVILLLWMNSAETVPTVVGLIVLPAYYFSILTAVDEKDARSSEALRLMDVSAPRRFLSEGWSYLLPFLKATSSSVVGMAWKAGVAAQLIGLALGTLGERVYQAKNLIEAPTLFALSAVIVLCAFLSEKLWMLLLDASEKIFVAAALAFGGVKNPEADGGAGGFVAQGISVSFDGKKVLQDLSFSVPPSLFVSGKSGIGKTTLCNVILGLLAPDSGEVKHPKKIGVVFQQSTLVPSLSVKQNLGLVCTHEQREEALSALREIAPDIDVNQMARTLSGGQARRVSIVRALFSTTEALVLDEPFVGLDEKSKKKAIALIQKRQTKQTRPMILVSHEKTDAKVLGLKTLAL